MKRFLKTLVLLVISLFVLVSGVDAALDHLSRSGNQNFLAVMSDKGNVVMAYTGDINSCKAVGKASAQLFPFRFLHRT